MKKLIKYFLRFLRPKTKQGSTTIARVLEQPIGGPLGQVFYLDYIYGGLLGENKVPLQHLEPEPLISIERYKELKSKKETIFPTTTMPVIGYAVSGGTNTDYITRWCGTTNNEILKVNQMDKEPLDPKPLKHFILKYFSWVKDVGVDEYETLRGHRKKLQIILTVTPTHYAELMNESIERKVREKLHKLIIPLFVSIYTEHNESLPIIIYQPELPSETILDLL